MKDITRYRIMRRFRSKHKIGDDLQRECPDPNYWELDKPTRCEDLCVHIWPAIFNCPCNVFGCDTALRKLDAWLRHEKKRLGVTG